MFSSPEILLSVSDKANLFAEIFSEMLNLDDPGSFLPTSIYNIHV